MPAAVNPTDLFRRCEGNPILTVKDWPYPANSVFNAAATRFKEQTLLLLRVEDLRGISHLTVATSQDGLTDWRISRTPALQSEPDTPLEQLGIEDARVVYMEQERKYIVCYTGYSQTGPLVCLATTTDFEHFQRHGAIMPPNNKDAAVFPRQINGRYLLIHRPAFDGEPANMWLASSPDLRHWGHHRPLMRPRPGWWDSQKIGLGPPPIETHEGWLIIYHGVRETAAGALYRAGLALLDLEDPSRVIRRSQQWIFGPATTYERIGDVGGANFPCGAVVDEQTQKLYLYYGAADTCIAVATSSVTELLYFLRHDC